jgi:hypothetical protein
MVKILFIIILLFYSGAWTVTRKICHYPVSGTDMTNLFLLLTEEKEACYTGRFLQENKIRISCIVEKNT